MILLCSREHRGHSLHSELPWRKVHGRTGWGQLPVRGVLPTLSLVACVCPSLCNPPCPMPSPRRLILSPGGENPFSLGVGVGGWLRQKESRLLQWFEVLYSPTDTTFSRPV